MDPSRRTGALFRSRSATSHLSPPPPLPTLLTLTCTEIWPSMEPSESNTCPTLCIITSESASACPQPMVFIFSTHSFDMILYIPCHDKTHLSLGAKGLRLRLEWVLCQSIYLRFGLVLVCHRIRPTIVRCCKQASLSCLTAARGSGREGRPLHVMTACLSFFKPREARTWRAKIPTAAWSASSPRQDRAM